MLLFYRFDSMLPEQSDHVKWRFESVCITFWTGLANKYFEIENTIFKPNIIKNRLIMPIL